MIHYQTHGHADSQPVILLHSGGMAGEEWQPQIAPLAQRYRVLVPDLPGHGKSELAGERLSVSLMAEAVLDMMDAEGIETANLCGSSMGGAVALWLTLKHPERVKRLVLYRISYRSNLDIHKQIYAMGDPAYWENFGLAAWLSKLHSPQGGADAWKQVNTATASQTWRASPARYSSSPATATPSPRWKTHSTCTAPSPTPACGSSRTPPISPPATPGAPRHLPKNCAASTAAAQKNKP